MKTTGFVRMLVSFLIAVVIAVAWGSVVQTQFNLGALASIGADIGPQLRFNATLQDLFSGFFPTYGGYIVLPALLVSLAVAEFVSRRYLPRWRVLLLTVAGFLGVLVAIPLVNQLSPVALLVGATRDWACTFFMSVGGAIAGFVFAWMTRMLPSGQRQATLEPEHAHPA